MHGRAPTDVDLLDTTQLLLAVLVGSANDVVTREFRGAGGDISLVRDAVMAHGRPDVVDPGPTLKFDREARDVLDDASREAATAEHVWIEAGHVLLAFIGHSSAGGRLLTESGVDHHALRLALESSLPTRQATHDELEASSEQYAKLSLDELSDVIAEVADWRRAIARVRSTKDSLTTSERNGVALVLDRTRSAWLRLQDHHLYLVWEAAQHSASRGHALEYSYMIGREALTGACLEAASQSPEGFVTVARERIVQALDRRFSATAPEHHDRYHRG